MQENIYLSRVPGGIATAPSLILEAPQAELGANFGWSLASTDFDADGAADLVAGAPGRSKVMIYFGGQSSFSMTPALVLEDPTDDSGAAFGRTLSALGARADSPFGGVLIGAPRGDGAAVDEGRAYYFVWSTATGLGGPPLMFAGPDHRSHSRFGAAVRLFDFDGNGHADLAIGAPRSDRGSAGEGAVFGYQSAAAGSLPLAPTTVLDPADQAHAHSGRAL